MSLRCGVKGIVPAKIGSAAQKLHRFTVVLMAKF